MGQFMKLDIYDICEQLRLKCSVLLKLSLVAHIKKVWRRRFRPKSSMPTTGPTLPLAIVAICWVATNISHWLKVQSRWIKNYIFAKQCILVSFWIFQQCFYFSFTFYYCTIFYSFDAGFYQCHQGVKHFGSRSGPTFCLESIVIKLATCQISMC